MVPASDASVSSSPFAPHWSLYPRTYVAPHTATPPAIDGDVDKPQWRSIPWSRPFDDIRGPDDAPPPERPTSNQTTRMKMMWDEEFLYVSALIESDFEVVAEFTDRNSPIFQRDSDFEAFLDPTGSCHRYKEFEMNAINTVWNLMLDRPYEDGGVEHSARVARPGEDLYYEVSAQRTAARVVRGRINDPGGGGGSWSVELALAHSDTLSAGTGGREPRAGDRWRVNFSRVEREGDVNWTWQPQRVWDASEGRVAGKVNMHLPDAWGYVEFGGPVGGGAAAGEAGERDFGTGGDCGGRDPTWPSRLAAINVYYAQRRHAELNGGRYAPDVAALGELVDPAIVGPFVDGARTSIALTLSEDGKRYTATVIGPGGVEVTVTNDRLVTVRDVPGQDGDGDSPV